MSKEEKKEQTELKPMSHGEMQSFIMLVMDEYFAAYKKHPGFAPIVLDHRADLQWVQKNLEMARDRLKEQLSADHIVNCEWMESLEEWKLAMDCKTKKDLEMHKDSFVMETAQAIATMIRYLQLGLKDIENKEKTITK